MTLIFWLRDNQLLRSQKLLKREGVITFAKLERGQKILTPFGGPSYYFTYSGAWRGRPFRAMEEVHPDLYFLLTEGKNAEVLVFLDPSGQLYTRIKANKKNQGKSLGMIQTLSWILAIAGLGLLGFSLGAGASRKKNESNPAAKHTDRSG